MRITLLLIAAFASLFLFVAEASACTCGDTTVAASKNYATIVFSGRIIKKVKSNAVEKDGVEVTFQVDRVWKGKVGPSVKIYSGPTSDLYDFMDLCSPDFELGDRYVVFARGEKLFSNIICSHTTKLKNGNWVLDQLGRGRRPTRSGVNFRIYGAEKVCLGEPIFLEARLTNDGVRSIQVEAGSMWRNFTERAFDQSSTQSTLGGAPLKIPKMRASSADGFQIGGKTSVLTIGKGESFSSFLVLNRSDDDFYDFPGRYAIGAIYSSDAARKSDEKADADSKQIEANEHVFQIIDCEGVVPER